MACWTAKQVLMGLRHACLFSFALFLVSRSVLAQETENSRAVVKLSLREAVSRFLETNPRVLIVKQTPEFARYDLMQAESELDYALSAYADFGKDVSPTSSSITGSTYTQEDIQASLSLEKKLLAGTELSLAWNNQRQETDARYANLNPAWVTSLDFIVRQPLLSGGWGGRPAIRIKARQKLHEAAFFDYQMNLFAELSELVSTYWNYKLALLELEVRAEAKELAESLLKEAKVAIDLGLQAPLAQTEAQVQLALKSEEHVSTQNRAGQMARELQSLVGGEDYLLSGLDLIPIEDPGTTFNIPDLATAQQVAFEKRPDWKAHKHRLESSKLSLREAENKLLPRLDLVVHAGVDGLAGDPQGSDFDTTSGTSFNGGYSSSLDRLGSGDYYNYGVGLSLNVPLENRSARANKGRAELSKMNEGFRGSTLRQTIIVEVQNSISTLKAAVERVSLTSNAEKLARENLEKGRELFNRGLSTSRELRERQNDLSEAQLSKFRGLIDYQIAYVDVLQAKGELLEYFGVGLERS